MKTVESVLATTRVDRHGDRFTKSALENTAAQAKRAYIPMMFNHDPRIPPLGRTIDAEVRQLPDGEYALVAISEVFEPGDDLVKPTEGRELKLRTFEPGRLTVVHDRSYQDDDDQGILLELSQLPDIRLESEEKKALEPLSVLLLALGGAATAFATGFIGKMGADAWEYLKPRLARLVLKRRAGSHEYLFIFELQVERETGLLSIQCILSSPSAEEFEAFWSRGIQALEKQLPLILAVPQDIRK